jgi:hypothetical protein
MWSFQLGLTSNRSMGPSPVVGDQDKDIGSTIFCLNRCYAEQDTENAGDAGFGRDHIAHALLDVILQYHHDFHGFEMIGQKKSLSRPNLKYNHGLRI